MVTAGFVLVGGQSRRMGRDKALLPWKSGVLVEEIAAKAAAIAGNVTLVGNPVLYGHLKLPCIPDLRPGLGPLAGLESALIHSTAALNLVLACDMPLIDDEHLGRLVSVARSSPAKCVVASDTSGRLHPLCAVYRRDCLPDIQAALDEDRLQLTAVVRHLNPEVVPVPKIILNVNSPVEWDALRNG